MKKPNMLLMALIPALMLGSCAKETEIGGQPETPAGTAPIVFGLESETQTRAVPVTGTTLNAGEKFGVYAYNLPSNTPGTPGTTAKANFVTTFMNDLEATVQADNKASYTGSKLWPANQDDRILFLAYYPYNASGVTKAVNTAADNNDPHLTLTYTIPAAHSAHQDLMVASAIPNYKADVALTFQHALTRLTFQAKKTGFPVDDVVKITELTLSGVRNKGDLKVTNVSGTTTASWTNTSGTETFTAGTLSTTINEEDTSILPTGEDSFLVLPLGARANFGTSPKITIIATWNGTQMAPFSVDLSALNHANNVWNMGQHVNYQFELKPTGIVFSGVSVTKWGDKKDVPVTFP